MDKVNQVETVKKALEIENTLVKLRNNLDQISAESFKNVPAAPICETIVRTYPVVKSNLQMDKVKAIVPSLVFWPWFFIYYFHIFKNEKLADEERIRNSDEYKQQCSELDKEFDKQQESANLKYQNAKRIYDTETIPKYNDERNKWTTQHNEKIEKVKNELDITESELNHIYDSTKIIPMQYRRIPVLQYIYDMISSSDYDIKEAIESYDKKLQRDLDMTKIREQQIANQQAATQNALLNEQNYLIDEQNAIADKARKEANAAAIVGAVQRHNTNKYLKK